MGLSLEVSCSHHQKGDGGYGREATIYIDSIDDKTQGRVVEKLEDSGWVVQFNGDNMDTYCSKKCAQ